MNARQTLMTNYSFSNSECWRASGRNFQTTIYGNTGCRAFKKGIQNCLKINISTQSLGKNLFNFVSPS